MGGFPAGPPEGGQKIPDLPLRVAARADGDGPGIKAGAELQRHPEFRFPSDAGEVRFRTAERTELEPAIEKVRAIVEAHPSPSWCPRARARARATGGEVCR